MSTEKTSKLWILLRLCYSQSPLARMMCEAVGAYATDQKAMAHAEYQMVLEEEHDGEMWTYSPLVCPAVVPGKIPEAVYVVFGCLMPTNPATQAPRLSLHAVCLTEDEARDAHDALEAPATANGEDASLFTFHKAAAKLDVIR